MPTVYPSKPRRGRELPINLSSREAERFWLFVEEQPSGCWEWIGSRDVRHGYGHYPVCRARWSNLRAHRVAWTLLRGPLPLDITIDHLCRNRACVNPDHLEPVTNRENILRGESPTAINARKTHCKRGHEFTEENSRTKDGRRECRVCIRIRQRVQWAAGKRKRGADKQTSRFCVKCRRHTRVYRRLDEGRSRHVLCQACDVQSETCP